MEISNDELQKMTTGIIDSWNNAITALIDDAALADTIRARAAFNMLEFTIGVLKDAGVGPDMVSPPAIPELSDADVIEIREWLRSRPDNEK